MDANNNFPKELPSLFFKDIDKYDIIGFDVDHCLVKYNIIELHTMTYKVMTDVLIKELLYPPSIQHITIEQLLSSLNGLICDCNTGCVLKLGTNKLILRAYYGFSQLAKLQIEEIYGSPPILSEFNITDQGKSKLVVHLTFFETTFSLMFMVLHEFKRKKSINKSTSEIRSDILYAIARNYQYWDYEKKIMFDMKSYGGFYKKIIDNPLLFIKKRPNISELLVNLKAKGKGLFIVTNSHYDFCDLTMTAAFGEDWRKYFDFCITGAKKPSFFQSSSNKFMKIDKSQPFFYGESVKGLLMHGKEYASGNYKDLELTYKEILKKPFLKTLYIGDNYISDCYWSGKNNGWDSVAIVEELQSIKINTNNININ